MIHSLQQAKSVRGKELFFFVLLYAFLAFSYHITLWFNSVSQIAGNQFFSPLLFADTAGLEYSIKLLLTLPIWWLIFKYLHHWSLPKRLAVHVITLPIFVLGSQQVHYWVAEQIGFTHLQGQGQVWDIYIPTLLYILIFGLLHAHEYYENNQRNIRRQAELQQAALRSELAAIRAQLNPHFLYNVFNTISASVPPEQEETRELIAQLSDLFRYQLKASRVERLPLEDELEFVEKYLALERARFEDRLEVEIDVPLALRQRLIPPMILQPLVENAIKHGIAEQIRGGKVSIRIWESEEGLAFEVADTGVGLADKQAALQQGVGLSNTQLRLEKLYNSSLQLTDNEPTGLRVQFCI